MTGLDTTISGLSGPTEGRNGCSRCPPFVRGVRTRRIGPLLHFFDETFRRKGSSRAERTPPTFVASFTLSAVATTTRPSHMEGVNLLKQPLPHPGRVDSKGALSPGKEPPSMSTAPVPPPITISNVAVGSKAAAAAAASAKTLAAALVHNTARDEKAAGSTGAKTKKQEKPLHPGHEIRNQRVKVTFLSDRTVVNTNQVGKRKVVGYEP